MLRVGTAGWAVPRTVADRFAGAGSQLERYATVFRCAEINSTFKHSHRASTYSRWAASTPADFRFSVKLPHEISHARKLAGADEPLDRFLGEAGELGERFGPLLVQLPASIALDAGIADTFFATLRRRFAGHVAFEPRHASWFEPGADALYARYRIGRVAADPARVPAAGSPGGWLGDADQRGLAYFRWHGAPRIYWSSYPQEQLDAWAAEVAAWSARGCDCWCIFDNTASGAAAENALDFAARPAVAPAESTLA